MQQCCDVLSRKLEAAFVISSASSHIIGVGLRSDCKWPRHLSSLVFLIDDGRSFVEFVVTLVARVKPMVRQRDINGHSPRRSKLTSHHINKERLIFYNSDAR